MPQILQALFLGSLMSKRNGKKTGFMGIAKPNQKGLMDLGELLEEGKVVPVIEKCYPLDEAPAAIRYVADGHARGKVVIQIS